MQIQGRPLKTASGVSSWVCRACQQRSVPRFQRSFTSSIRARAEASTSTETSNDTRPGVATTQASLPRSTTPRPFSFDLPRSRSNPSTASTAPMPSDILASMTASKSGTSAGGNTSKNSNAANFDDFLNDFAPGFADGPPQPHRLHIYSHKHNTHITLVQPAKLASQTTGSGISATTTKAAEQNKMIDVLLSVSTGNIGFRKAGRGSYDAAYQLMGFVLRQIQERGLLRDIRKLEVALRGFGPGREATTKALLGAEGKHLRGRVTAVFDVTRLKHGGTRGQKPRRLG